MKFFWARNQDVTEMSSDPLVNHRDIMDLPRLLSENPSMAGRSQGWRFSRYRVFSGMDSCLDRTDGGDVCQARTLRWRRPIEENAFRVSRVRSFGVSASVAAGHLWWWFLWRYTMDGAIDWPWTPDSCELAFNRRCEPPASTSELEAKLPCLLSSTRFLFFLP